MTTINTQKPIQTSDVSRGPGGFHVTSTKIFSPELWDKIIACMVSAAKWICEDDFALPNDASWEILHILKYGNTLWAQNHKQHAEIIKIFTDPRVIAQTKEEIDTLPDEKHIGIRKTIWEGAVAFFQKIQTIRDDIYQNLWPAWNRKVISPSAKISVYSPQMADLQKFLRDVFWSQKKLLDEIETTYHFKKSLPALSQMFYGQNQSMRLPICKAILSIIQTKENSEENTNILFKHFENVWGEPFINTLATWDLYDRISRQKKLSTKSE